jgi:hypothetical protein
VVLVSRPTLFSMWLCCLLTYRPGPYLCFVARFMIQHDAKNGIRCLQLLILEMFTCCGNDNWPHSRQIQMSDKQIVKKHYFPTYQAYIFQDMKLERQVVFVRPSQLHSWCVLNAFQNTFFLIRYIDTNIWIWSSITKPVPLQMYQTYYSLSFLLFQCH